MNPNKNTPKSGYGNLTNFIRFSRVIMIEHQEGDGTEENPLRAIRTFFTPEGELLNRIDPFKKEQFDEDTGHFLG